ncbi:TetR/AcrR family transcriptional regulator [Streptomyces aidingensis]|uniref:DNA-binding transcriptional regulator, AcrR family n=1 Tax=Streptomyces aidingensis TaxID=910347 RepID=A0A1I1F0I0_9ACTN|nr:TetR/AcrR family transcriptional regulator [Streptomyces aidingensis]SFB92949.1 DNA-binding transcriptional regulator, AcrR family [Streptomyces aidingensis]
MPTARESLLKAARAAVHARPWQGVRMVDVAAAAGVSRQTLYNEFGDKAGLGAALMEQCVRGLLRGLEEHLRHDERTSDEEALAAAADWMVIAARGDRLVRASLTGCRCPGVPGPPPDPGSLLAQLRDRAVRTLSGPHGSSDEALPHRCETALRLALSHVVAPAAA